MLFEILSKSALLLTESDIVIEGLEGLEDAGIEVVPSSGQASSWPSPVIIALCVLLAAVCITLVVIIMLQKKRASGIGAAIAGSGETYWSKNKGKSVEGTLEKYTKWGGAAFIVVALLINILM